MDSFSSNTMKKVNVHGLVELGKNVVVYDKKGKIKRKSDENISTSGLKLKKLKTLGLSISKPTPNLPSGLNIVLQTSSIPPPSKFEREAIVEKISAENAKSDKVPKFDIEKLNIEHCSDMKNVKGEVDSLKILDKKSEKGISVGKNPRLTKSHPADQMKETGTKAESGDSNSNSSISNNQCTQCGKSSAHIVAIVKQVNELENRLMTDLNQKEDMFKMEKESWKVREHELMEALAKQDDSKEIEAIKAELKRTNDAMVLKIAENQDLAIKTVELQKLNDEYSEK